MQIWPAIDIRGGHCVRLRQGDYDQETVFSQDPVQTARQWIEQGAQQLHLVDLDGAREGRLINREVVAGLRRAVSVPCQLGGGIRDERAISELLEIGLDRLVVGTRALREPEWFRGICRRFPGKLALGLDARNGRVATDGWQQTSEILATELASSFSGEPLAAIVYTDIARDGMMSGPNFAATGALVEAVDLPVLASGGVTTASDVRQLVQLKVAGCIVGRSLYEGTLRLADALAAAKEN